MTFKLKEDIREKIGMVLNISPNMITDLLELGRIGLNSVKTVVLVVTLEERYNITFADQELHYEYFSTLERIESLIINKLSAK